MLPKFSSILKFQRFVLLGPLYLKVNRLKTTFQTVSILRGYVPEFCFFLLHHESIYNSPTNRNNPKGNLILGACHSAPQRHVYPNNTNIPPMSSDFQAMSRPNHMMNIAIISICTTKDNHLLKG
jgi:hypothetical protein